MFAFLPLISFLSLFLLFNKHHRTHGRVPCWRTSFLSSTLTWGLLIVISTELLSIFKLINFGCILTFWLLVISCTGTANVSLHKRIKTPIIFKLPNFSFFETFLLGAILFILAITALTAFIAPPNTWDSMTYHMSRVVHWIQNHSVAHYPTHIERQLTFTPWAEFAITHFQILSFSDRFANLIQWFSMLGSIIGVSMIAKILGSDRRGQILAAILAATIPMGILQASSTQNDYVVTFWLTCFVYYSLLLKAQLNWENTIAVAASLGLSILTKGTAYIFSLPFLLWLTFSGIKRHRTKFCAHLATIILAAVLINSGYYLRNFGLYNNTFAPLKSTVVGQSGGFNTNAFISKIICNIGLHLETPFKAVNALIEKGIYNAHAWLNIDASVPHIHLGEHAFSLTQHAFHEDHSGNFIHLLLIVVTGILFLVSYTQHKKNKWGRYLLSITLGFLLFNLFLQWTPFNSRYHLPLFILATPFIGFKMAQIRNHKITTFLTVILILSSIPWLFYNQSRPILSKKNILNTSRTDQYFANNPGMAHSYKNVIKNIGSTECTQIGLLINCDSWEYPFWPLFQNYAKKSYRIEHVNVDNVSASIPYFNEDFKPCAIITKNTESKLKIIVNKMPYIKRWRFSFFNVFLEDTTGELAKGSIAFHFNRVIEYSLKADNILDLGTRDGRKLKRKEFQAMIALRQIALKEAQSLDIDELNQIYTGLGNHFKNDLMKGSELLIIGFNTPDPTKYRQGNLLLEQWAIWLKKNSAAMQKAWPK